MFESSKWMYSSGAAPFYDHEIDGSLVLERDDSARLDKTFASGGIRSQWTLSMWVKRHRHSGSQEGLFSARAGSTQQSHLWWESDGKLRYETKPSGDIYTVAQFRDPSAWYHIVLKKTSSTVTIYVNGEAQSVTGTTPASGEHYINDNIAHRIGGQAGGSEYISCSIADVYFIDNQALNPTSFGETKSGVWIPKAYTGGYGTTGFHLPLNGNANDDSGNGNNWTANNISGWDYTSDSPTFNCAVFNFLHESTESYVGTCNARQGGFRANGFTGEDMRATLSIAPSSGKWFVEYYIKNRGQDDHRNGIGIGHHNSYRARTYGILYQPNGQKCVNDTRSSYGATWTTGDVIGVALDCDNNQVTFYKNGSSQGTLSFTPQQSHIFFEGYSTNASSYLQISCNTGQEGTHQGSITAGGNSDANGYGDFKYSVPSGYLTLCTANLTVAEGVDPAEDNSPQDHFSVKLYPGNSSTQSITGVGFQPSITWIKSRNHGHNPELYQAVEGATKMWMTSYNDSDTTRSTGLTSFNSDGFSLGSSPYTNQSGLNFVAWNWKGNGAGSSNSTGSITATVSANPDGGISIMKWTGTGASGNIAHGLSSAPKFLINKGRYGEVSGFTPYWNIWCTGMSITKRVFFSSDAQADAQGGWGNTEPSDSLIYLGSKDELNGSGGNFSMIAFAPVDGFSSFGSYVGNGSTDGAFIYTGFRVAYVLVKKITAGENWSTADNKRSPYNVSQNGLQPGTANSENTTSGFAIDFLANGFKPRSGAGQWNDSGATYIYAAFAENPFKYSTAR